MRNPIIGLMGVLLLMVACKSELTPEEMVHFVKQMDNGLQKSVAINGVQVEALLKPVDYIVALEERTNRIHAKTYSKTKAELEGLEYYQLKLSTPGFEDKDITTFKNQEGISQGNMTYYLSYEIKNHIKLATTTDTLRPVMCHFERSYGVRPDRILELAFERPDDQKADRTLILNSKTIAPEAFEITFKAEDINNVPQLKRTI